MKTPPMVLTDPDLLLSLVDSAAEHANIETLLKYMPLIEEAFQETNHPLHKAISLRSSGVLHRLQGDFQQAEEKNKQALEMYQGFEAQYQIGRTHYELGQLGLAKNNLSRAKGHFSAALKAFEEMRAVPAIERTKAALQNIGEKHV